MSFTTRVDNYIADSFTSLPLARAFEQHARENKPFIQDGQNEADEWNQQTEGDELEMGEAFREQYNGEHTALSERVASLAAAVADGASLEQKVAATDDFDDRSRETQNALANDRLDTSEAKSTLFTDFNSWARMASPAAVNHKAMLILATAGITVDNEDKASEELYSHLFRQVQLRINDVDHDALCGSARGLAAETAHKVQGGAAVAFAWVGSVFRSNIVRLAAGIFAAFKGYQAFYAIKGFLLRDSIPRLVTLITNTFSAATIGAVSSVIGIAIAVGQVYLVAVALFVAFRVVVRLCNGGNRTFLSNRFFQLMEKPAWTFLKLNLELFLLPYTVTLKVGSYAVRYLGLAGRGFTHSAQTLRAYRRHTDINQALNAYVTGTKAESEESYNSLLAKVNEAADGEAA